MNIEKLIASTNNNPTTIEGSEQSLLLFQHHQRILREVKMFASLSNHVNVVRYYNAWVESASNVTDSESDSEDDSRFDLIKSSPKKSQKKSLLNPERIKCEKQSFIYIQMQLCMLNDLRHWIDQRTTRLEGINTEKNLEILWQILCGLGHIHAQNIVHRDVKPGIISSPSSDSPIIITSFREHIC